MDLDAIESELAKLSQATPVKDHGEILAVILDAAPKMAAEIRRLTAAVHELEEMVSAAESRANERGNTIHWLRELCGDADEWISDHQPDTPSESMIYLLARLRAASKGEQ